MSFQILKHNIKNALKQNIVPGLILQSVAIAIACSYFFWPASQPVFAFFSALKVDYGWRYALIATGIFGGLIPLFYLYVIGQVKGKLWILILFHFAFWAYRGVEINLVYQLQAWLFGNELNFVTIVQKTAVDQFIYSALWAAPTIIVIYRWRDAGFNFSRWIKSMDKSFWRLEIPTVIISNWLIWIPAASIIYTMPAPLQLPLFNLVLCFFVILIASLGPEKQASNAPIQKPN